MAGPDPSQLKVLYAGPLAPHELCLVRCLALEDLGTDVVRFDSSPYLDALRSSLALRAVRKVFPRVLLGAINRAFLAAIRDSRPDVVYVDKGVFFTPGTVRRALETRSRRGLRPVFLHFHPDDAFHPLLYSALYKRTLTLYDCHFIPHRWVLEQHLARGARRAEFWPYGYYPPVHAPVAAREAPAPDLAVDVAFVGRWEASRAHALERLSRDGVGVGVWGTIWERLAAGSPLRSSVRWRSAVGKELAAIASLSRISLGFLSDTNLNGHTSRTFEIPACGGFMLAQRSDGQREFFEEGREMECFDSFDEMRDKIHWYLGHESEREKIRTAGLERCQRSGYSYLDRFRFVLKVAEECRAAIGSGRAA